jgi:hypothetical protein
VSSTTTRPRRWLAKFLGHVLAGLARGVASLRPADKPLHPHGNVLSGTLRRVGAQPPTGVPWLDEPGTEDVIVRLSRAVGLPARAPDIFGLALRTPVGAGHGDLLFASTGLGKLGRFVLRPSRSPFDRPMTTLLPYRTDQGPLVMAAVGTSPDTLDIVCARGTGPWRRVGTLQLVGEGSDAMISFDPLLNAVPGLDNYPLVHALREPAYRIARRSRRRSGSKE